MNDPAKIWNLYQVYLDVKDEKDPDLTFEDFRTVFFLSREPPSSFVDIAFNSVIEKYGGDTGPGKHRKCDNG